MLPCFRTVSSKKELIEAFNLCNKDGLELTIWQNLEGSRETGLCTIQKIIDRDELLIFLDVSEDFSYDENLEFHLYQEELSFLFKGRFSKVQKKQLVLSLNLKIYLKEKRDNTRFTFKDIFFQVKIDFFDSISENKKSLRGTLRDISEKGISFMVPVTNALLLSEGTSVSLNSIEGIVFSKPILGEIKYNLVIKSKNQTEVKYGMEFKSESTEIAEVLHLLKKNLA